MFALQGRVEVRKNGIWGTICNDNTDEKEYDSNQYVDDRAAEVICRQMGWTVGRLVEMSIVPDGTQQIWMDNLNCADWPSTKDHVAQCEHADKDTNGQSGHGHWQWGTIGDCNHAKDIGVGCDAQTTDSIAGSYPGIRIIKHEMRDSGTIPSLPSGMETPVI